MIMIAASHYPSFMWTFMAKWTGRMITSLIWGSLACLRTLAMKITLISHSTWPIGWSKDSTRYLKEYQNIKSYKLSATKIPT
jgi:hypothetical protein